LSITGPFGISLDIDSLPDGFVYIDGEGLIRAFNRAAERLFGHAPAEVVGMPMSVLIPQVGERLSQSSATCGVLPALRKDGATFHADLSLQPLPSAEERHWVALIRASSAMEERFLASLVSAVADGVCAVDVQGRCTYVNEGTERLLGYGPGELLGLEIGAVIRGPQPDPISQLLVKCPDGAPCAEGRPCRLGECKLRRKDGTLISAEYTLSPLCEAGQTIGAVLAIRDISKLRAMVRDLNILANQDVDLALSGEGDYRLTTFTPGSLSHEGANPAGLGGVIGSGVNQYQVKPLTENEPRTLGRRSSDRKEGEAPPPPVPAWDLNLATGKLLSPHGDFIPLTSRELELLTCLMESPNVIVPKNEILTRLYPREKHLDNFQRVATLVSRLRVKTEDDFGYVVPVRTVFGRGLVFVGSAQVSPPPPPPPPARCNKLT